MRLTTVMRVRPGDQPLTFVGERGEHVIVTVISESIIRVRLYPDGKPRLDRTWTVGRDGVFPLEGLDRDHVPALPADGRAFTIESSETAVTLTTSALRLTIHLDPLQLEWWSADGDLLAADLPRRAYTYDRTGRAIAHYLRLSDDERFYGLGETSGSLNKRGRRLTLKPLDALGYNAETGDPLYKHFPFYITQRPDTNHCFGLFYDNLAPSTFDFGQEIDAFWGDYRCYRADDGDLDYYLIDGPDIGAILERFTRLTGRPALLPDWALGYLGSTMSYTDAPDAQEQLRRFVDLCQQHDIPCSMFHLSSGYTTDAAGRRNIFTWNRSKIPDPRSMTQYFHDAGIRLAANIKPHLLTTHPDYDTVRQLGGFIRDPDTHEPVLAMMWSGGAGESAFGSYIDFTSHAGYAWWKARITEQLLAYGIDAIWNDNNEFELWDDDAICDGFGRPFRLGQGRPLQTLLMARASFEAVQEYAPDAPPFILTRSACPGVQRYAQSWSGDNRTSWHTLQWNIPMGVGIGLSGFPSYGHDIGGFAGPAPDPELFVRWVQCGIYQPRFTIHSWNSDGTVNEPWMHPEVLPIIRSAIILRYRLLPYLAARMRRAHTDGKPVMQPLFYANAEPDAREADFEYLLGDDLLVAPVYQPDQRTRQVYLPDGFRWRELHTGTWYDGGQHVEVPAPLEWIPVFGRGTPLDQPAEVDTPFERVWRIDFMGE